MTSFNPQTEEQIADEDVIMGIRSGSEQAFSQLFHLHYLILVGYAESFLDFREEAEEIVCDLFVRIYEIRTDWNPRGSLRGYLFKAVRNRVLNQIRGREREHARNILYTTQIYMESDMEEGTTELPQENEDGNEQVLIALNAAIDSLPPRAREVISLRWKEGMSDETIAEITDSTIAGVRMQASRALKVLRERLPQYLK